MLLYQEAVQWFRFHVTYFYLTISINFFANSYILVMGTLHSVQMNSHLGYFGLFFWYLYFHSEIQYLMYVFWIPS